MERDVVAARALCPICNKRRAERYCPALGEKICAVDCGTGREVSIDCPYDCPHLLAAHRWEEEHRPPLAEGDIPFPDVSFPADLVHEHGVAVSGLGHAVLVYAAENRPLTDADVSAAVRALAETYRTLVSGIYYAKPPDPPIQAGLYAALAKFWDDFKKRQAGQQRYPTPKDSEIFLLLVFFLRFAFLHTNGRPRSRAFLAFLRSQFPAGAVEAREEPRIIMP